MAMSMSVKSIQTKDYQQQFRSEIRRKMVKNMQNHFVIGRSSILANVFVIKRKHAIREHYTLLLYDIVNFGLNRNLFRE